MSKSDEKVQIYNRVNRLKLKAGAASLHEGPGYIDPNAINRAQTVIETKETLYMEEVEKVLIQVEKAWDAAIKAEGVEKIDEALEKLYHQVNHIKDLAATYNYELMQHFGLSLREFAEKIDVKNKAHHIIVQAHIDVMWVVYHEKIKDQGGDKAGELKLIVAKAIEKYS